MWRIFTSGNEISSGVVYGILPDSALIIDGPTLLIAGTQYELVVYWRISPGEDIENFEGPFTRVFIP